MRPLTFRISTARNKIKCQGGVRIKCIIESSGKKASILNGGHWNLLVIAKNTAMQITSWCFRLFCSPLATPGISMCSLNREKESGPPEKHRGPNSQAICSQTTEQLKSPAEQQEQRKSWGTVYPMSVRLYFLRHPSRDGGWKQNNDWKRSVSGPFPCLNVPLLLPLRRLWRWCGASAPFLV